MSNFRARAERGGLAKTKSRSLKIERTLGGSLSAISTPIFATKYSLEISWRDLSDLHPFAPLQLQNFSNSESEETARNQKKVLGRVRWRNAAALDKRVPTMHTAPRALAA